MKKLLATLFFILIASQGFTATWDKGFNFRGSSGYVTDGTDETYVIGDSYPTTRNGVTFGWLTSIGTQDNDSTVDRRLAGTNYSVPTGTATFQVDLTVTGAYDIRYADGSTAGSGQVDQHFKIYDNTSLLVTNTQSNVALDHYIDATNVDRSEADWPSLNAINTQTFATTTFKLTIGDGTTGGYQILAHLFLSQSSGGGAPNFFYRRRGG